MRYQTSLTIPITVVRDCGEPLHEQIATQVGAAVDDGLLSGDTRLPSTRTLAELLGVSRGVTTAAYELLFTRGYLTSLERSGTFVTRPYDEHRAPPPRPVGPSANPVDLRPGQVNAAAFPLSAWRAAWRQAGFRRPPSGALPALGLPELRRAVAEHVARTRGAALAGHEVVITGGAAHGLRTVLDALELRGPRVAVEEPTPSWLHAAATGDEGRPAALRVDADGARLDAVPAGCRALVVSLGPQMPLGHVLAAGRRLDAAAWAARTGGHLIEVDHDGVLPARPRIPAGTGSILLGGFCSLLTPALKLGYAIVPRGLAEPIGRRLADHAEQPPYVTQLAVASLLRGGTVVRLMHRLGRLYADRGRVVESALGSGRDGAGEPGGTAVRYLPRHVDAEEVARRLLGRGVRVATLAPYHFSGRWVPPALVFGYGHASDAELRRGLRIMRGVLTARRWRPQPAPAGAR